jgi:basic membrane protein A and related proteins
MRTSSRRQFLKYGGATGAALITGLQSGLARSNGVLAQQLLKVGVVYVAPVANVGWTKQHSLAVEALQAQLGDRVDITVVDSVVDPQHAEQVFLELAASRHHLIFGTSFVHGAAMHSVAPQFPNVAFEHASGVASLQNLGTFEARYYEGGYVAGVAAGHMTRSGKVGFIASFPLPDFVSTANALVLGARRVRPDATCEAVFLESWFNPEQEYDAAGRLMAQGCDVICSMTGTAAGVQAAGERGAWSIGYASDMAGFAAGKQLTAIVLDWTSVYVEAAQAVVAGDWQPQQRWSGLATGVVTMAPHNTAIPDEARAELEQTEADIASGALHPFAGELRDQQGDPRVAAGEVLTEADIRAMNWLVEGMIGTVN